MGQSSPTTFISNDYDIKEVASLPMTSSGGAPNAEHTVHKILSLACAIVYASFGKG